MKRIYIAWRRVAGEVEGLHVYRTPPFVFDNILGAVDTLEYWARRCSCGDCSRLLAGAGWTGGAERAFGLQGSQKSGLAVATLRPAHSPPEDPHQWVGAMYSECGDHLYVEIATVNQGRGPGHPCEPPETPEAGVMAIPEVARKAPPARPNLAAWSAWDDEDAATMSNAEWQRSQTLGVLSFIARVARGMPLLSGGTYVPSTLAAVTGSIAVACQAGALRTAKRCLMTEENGYLYFENTVGDTAKGVRYSDTELLASLWGEICSDRPWWTPEGSWDDDDARLEHLNKTSGKALDSRRWMDVTPDEVRAAVEVIVYG